MAMDFVGTIKEHPIAIGAGVVVLLLLMSGRKSAPSTTQSSGSADAYVLQSQKINSDTNIALSSINAKASVERARISSENFKATTAAQAALGSKNTDALITTFLGGLNASNVRNAADNQLTSSLNSQMLAAGTAAKSIDADVRKFETGAHVSMAGISADVQKMLMGKDIAVLNNNLQSMIAANTFALGNREIDVKNRQVDLSGKALDISRDEQSNKTRLAELGLNIANQADIRDSSNTLYGLETNRKSAEMMSANLPSILTAQQAIAQLQSDTEIRKTKLMTEPARKSADTNIFKTLLSGAAQIFSFF